MPRAASFPAMIVFAGRPGDLPGSQRRVNLGPNTGYGRLVPMGDANGDRVFDSLDEKLIQMSGNYEATPSPRRSAASAVPDPILLSLVGMGLVFLLLAYTALQGQRQQNRAAKN